MQALLTGLGVFLGTVLISVIGAAVRARGARRRHAVQNTATKPHTTGVSRRSWPVCASMAPERIGWIDHSLSRPPRRTPFRL